MTERQLINLFENVSEVLTFCLRNAH
jgi:hypothetical protein